jgi:hypothetical protein
MFLSITDKDRARRWYRRKIHKGCYVIRGKMS